MLSGLGSEIARRAQSIPWHDRSDFERKDGLSIATPFKDANGPVTAEQLYVNQKVSDLISNAEMEQSDYRRGGKPNVFFRQTAESAYFRISTVASSFSTPPC